LASIITNTSIVIIMIAIIISFLRLILGKSLVDRVVALDAMTIISISLIVYLAAFFQRAIYADIALVYALMSFLGVIAVARYIEGGL